MLSHDEWDHEFILLVHAIDLEDFTDLAGSLHALNDDAFSLLKIDGVVASQGLTTATVTKSS